MAKFSDLVTKYKDEMLENFGSSFYHDPITISLLTLFSLLLAALLLLLILRVQPGATHLPLTYNVIFGVTYSSSWFGPYLYLLGITGLGIVNFLIAWAYFDKERLLSYLIGSVNILLVALTILIVYNLTALAL